jgi:hypothetical protein
MRNQAKNLHLPILLTEVRHTATRGEMAPVTPIPMALNNINVSDLMPQPMLQHRPMPQSSHASTVVAKVILPMIARK